MLNKIFAFILSIILFIFTVNVYASVQVLRYPSNNPVQVCQPSDTNTNCGGGGGVGTLTLTDGSNTVSAVTHVAITGATVGGATPNATLTISSSSYSTTFTNSDLSSGILTVTHSLGVQNVIVEIFNSSNQLMIPDQVTLINTNSFSVNLNSFGTISGTWTVVVLASGSSTSTFTRCSVIPDISSSDTHFPMGSFATQSTVKGVWCTCSGTCTTKATFTLENGSGTGMTITGTNPTCTNMGSIPTVATVTANNVLTAQQSLRFNVTNTPNPTTDTYEVCVSYTD